MRVSKSMVQASSGGAIVYGTWNPADKATNCGLSGSDLIYTSNVSQAGVRATVSGVGHVWEIVKNTSGETNYGIATSAHSLNTYVGGSTTSVGYDSSDGKLYKNGAVVGTGTVSASTTGDIIGIAVDATDIKVWKNGTLIWTYAHGLAGALYPAGGDFAVGQFSTLKNTGASLTHSASYSGYLLGIY